MTLTEKLEAATGPDRELDAHIWCHLHGKKYKGHWPAYNSDATQVEYTEPPKRTRLVTMGIASRPHAERFTGSIDAAMTLVEDDWEWKLDNDTSGECAPFKFEMGLHIYGEAPTPALAICIAAIKAKGVEA